MRFAQVTTFFGAESFGGDAVHVARLAGALAARGHEVDVFHSPASFRLLATGPPPPPADPLPAGVRAVSVPTSIGPLSPLWTHQTGRLGPGGRWLAERLRSGDYDVIHLHNVSLLGGPALIEDSASLTAAAVMTAHDHWLTCQQSTRFDRRSRRCEPRCSGWSCAVGASRPPQLWRHHGRLAKAVGRLDAVIAPSEHAAMLLAEASIESQILTPFLAPGWERSRSLRTAPGDRGIDRPYVAAAGRLVPEKGFDRLVEMMAKLPEIDLVIAGEGPQRRKLSRAAAKLPNVRLTGRLSSGGIADLFSAARAVVVPSVWWEPFGIVTIEAAAVGTPVIVRNTGGLAGAAHSLGGIVCDGDREIARAIAELASDAELAAGLGRDARAAVGQRYGAASHLDAYEQLLGIRRGTAEERTAGKVA